MGTLSNILLHIFAYIFWGVIFIGIIALIVALIRFMIGPLLGEDFNPMRGWWK